MYKKCTLSSKGNGKPDGISVKAQHSSVKCMKNINDDISATWYHATHATPLLKSCKCKQM